MKKMSLKGENPDFHVFYQSLHAMERKRSENRLQLHICVFPMEKEGWHKLQFDQHLRPPLFHLKSSVPYISLAVTVTHTIWYFCSHLYIRNDHFFFWFLELLWWKLFKKNDDISPLKSKKNSGGASPPPPPHKPPG